MKIEEIEILSCLIENEIKSDLDYINDVEGKEKEYYEKYVEELKVILSKLKKLNGWKTLTLQQVGEEIKNE